MAINKLPFLIGILIVQVLFITNSQAQCSLKVDYKIEPNPTGSSDVRIHSLEGTKNVKIQLYDLNSGQVIDQKESNLTGSFKTIFTNVKTSIYLLYIWLPGCNKPVVVGGDKQGIRIEN
jgi:hypothetical protein